MWKDLEWQGWDFHQQRTLASRERKAEEYAFFIGPLLEAAALPAAALERDRTTLLRHRK